ncbi:MAG: hypothetical protein R2822_09150 [Spirosomataceae bacterium]
MHQYPHPTRLLVAIDCIIFGFDGEEMKLLIIKRNFEPERGKWSLMGVCKSRGGFGSGSRTNFV